MDFKQHLQTLHQEMVAKLITYQKAEERLVEEMDATGGFFDKTYLDKSEAAKRDWQQAHNEFYGLLSFVQKKH